MKEFKTGDKVQVVNYCNFNPRIEHGMVGKIVKMFYPNIGIEFYKNIGGHDCDGKGKSGHCWWIDADNLVLVNCDKVIITSNGKTTTAKLIGNNKTIKTAIANCNPKDEFNFEIGAKLAFKRLFEVDKFERFFNKEICLKIPNKEVYMKFAKECDERNVRWFTGSRLVEWRNFNFPVYLICTGKYILWGYHKPENSDSEDLTMDDFDSNIESEINVGDYVYVTNKGKQYVANVIWVEKHAKDYLGKFSYNKDIPDESVNNKKYKVIAKGPLYTSFNHLGYFLESTDGCLHDYFLFDEEGIKKC